MKLRLRRWFFGWLEVLIDRAAYWQTFHDVCEICGKGTVDRVCIGCDRRIDYECESGYYSDVDLCVICRKEITPEQEAEDLRESAVGVAEETF